MPVAPTEQIGVVPGAAHQQVVARPAIDQVVAALPVQHVAATVARQAVVASGAVQRVRSRATGQGVRRFRPVQGVVAVASRADRRHDRRIAQGRSVREFDPVHPVFVVHVIEREEAFHRHRVARAFEPQYQVRSVAADGEVRRRDAGLELQHVDRAGLVAFQVVPIGRRIQVPVRVARQRAGGIAHRVLPVAPTEQIGVIPGAAHHQIVARPAVEQVVAGLPLQGFRSGSAMQVAGDFLQLEVDVDQGRIGHGTVDDE